MQFISSRNVMPRFLDPLHQHARPLAHLLWPPRSWQWCMLARLIKDLDDLVHGRMGSSELCADDQH